jgi:hypothetical protein
MHGARLPEPFGSITDLERLGRHVLDSAEDGLDPDDQGCNAVLLLQQFGEVCCGM